MQQVILIHWGDCYRSNDDFAKAIEKWDYNPFEEKKIWRYALGEKFPSGFQYIAPQMPNKDMASYNIREIWFEKLFPYLEGNPIVIGHSLGGLFLSKYLAENTFPMSISQLYLLATPSPDLFIQAWEYLADFPYEVSLLPHLEKQVEQIFIYHSKDDLVLPFIHGERLAQYLPSAKFMVFEDRGHFNQAEFPEIVENILSN